MSAITSPLPVPFESEAVQHALHLLPARHRVALDLRFDEGLSERDVAAVLGCRTATAHALLVRGVRRLRQLLADDGTVTAGRSRTGAPTPLSPGMLAR